MQVIKKFNTNVELYNLLLRGVEGEHWVRADEANLVIGLPRRSYGGHQPLQLQQRLIVRQPVPVPTPGPSNRWVPGKPPKS